MKPLYSILAAVMFLSSGTPLARAGVGISVDFFHDNLESYGDWREVGDYGYCWQPRHVDRNWRPYSDGRWLYTDAGWTWDSDEPYSWAVYHYGRWARVARVGWVWVPGTEWGPAWVSWRRSPRHVGWAPLPPEAEFSRSVGFNTRVDADYDIGPTNYSFVEVRNFGAPRLRAVIVERRQNLTIINQTTNITSITYVNNVVHNQGPQYDVISRESAQPIRRLKLDRREELNGDPRTVPAEQLRSKVEGDSLRVPAPPFASSPATAPRKLAAKVEKAEVDHGWKNAGPPAQVAKLRTKIKSEPAATAEVLSQPKTEKTAETPAVSAVPSPMPQEKPEKGKARNVSQPTIPTVPGKTEAARLIPEKAVVADKPTKPSKSSKKVKPVSSEATTQQPSPTRAAVAAPSTQSKKTRNKVNETSHLSKEAVPQAQVQREKTKARNIEPTRNVPSAAVEAPHQKFHQRVEAPPKPAQPAARNIERNVSNISEPRHQAKKPEIHQQAPAVAKPQQTQPTKQKGKSKGTDEKKDAAKQEGALQ